MKLTRKQIEVIRENTPQELKGRQTTISQSLGYFQPSGANWSYCAGWARLEANKPMVLVVTRFGEIM